VWPYLCRKFRKNDSLNLDVISRMESASTATGYAKQHAAQQAHIVTKAFETPVGAAVKETIKKTTEKMANAGAD
jgi:2-oxoglutarate dehydrogenase E1 component